MYYMAPEVQKSDKYSKNVDIYAVGVTIYKIFTDEFPYLSIKDWVNGKIREPDNDMEQKITKVV